ncbi:response regulator transcription factor [Paenibacillus hunanensis]|uniref:response regulator transcription factor n=1 Tax=Paenibacillus hunanensis TaxID=539262 RepID=UPI002A69B61B|nr:response regulator transcription factor [Paenibacillus hunanensis]WPP41110.1 response regulator transcription factor [Paenibacillus hunanensis]
MTEKKILIAEDEPALRFLLMETLEDEGYMMTEAEDGQLAKDRLAQQEYDLIVLDYMMPEATGIEVCEWLRASGNANAGKPVILLTAKAQEQDRLRAEQAGVTLFMSKPFSPLALIDAAEELLEREDA